MTRPRVNQTTGGGPPARPHKVELGIFALLLLFCNWPGAQPHLTFLPAAVARGEWWRLVTHPFTHVSWYHLLLDGGAFLMLYRQLAEPRRWARLSWVAACGAGSLALAAPVTQFAGLCGLSGVAHGLMVIVAIEMLGKGDRVGGLCLAGVIAKTVGEAWTGRVLLEPLHFGLMGTPIAICHLGGVLGGLLAFLSVEVWTCVSIRVLPAAHVRSCKHGDYQSREPSLWR